MSRGLWIACLVLLGGLQAPYAHAAESEFQLNELAEDYSSMSPRIVCFTGLVKSRTDSQVSLKTQAELDAQAADPRIEAHVRSILAVPYEARGQEDTFRNKIVGTVWDMGYLAGASRPNLRRLAAVRSMLASIEPVAPLNRDTLSALAHRDCALEYIAAAYGVGEPRGEQVYRERIDQWTATFDDGKPTYYTEELVALNYLVSREYLASGDTVSAFRMSNDPVMRESGSSKFSFAAQWRASFHLFGIGTPKSISKAIAIYDASHFPDNDINAALLKASIGRRVEAAAQLKSVMDRVTYTDRNYTRAADAYTEITGTDVARGPPTALQIIVAIPVVIMAFCIENPQYCKGSSSSGGGSAYDDTAFRDRGRACSRRVSDLYNQGFSLEVC